MLGEGRFLARLTQNAFLPAEWTSIRNLSLILIYICNECIELNFSERKKIFDERGVLRPLSQQELSLVKFAQNKCTL